MAKEDSKCPVNYEIILDSKFCLNSSNCSTLKFAFANKKPSFGFSNMMNLENNLFGLNINCENIKSLKTKLELLFGRTIPKEFLSYMRFPIEIEMKEKKQIKHSIIIGLYLNKTLKSSFLDYFYKDESFLKKYEFGLEACYNNFKYDEFHPRNLAIELADKITLAPFLSISRKLNHALIYSKNVCYNTANFMKINFSSSLNLQKLFTKPAEGFDFKYGFMIELAP